MNMDEEIVNVEQINLKQERRFCSGIGWNYFIFLAVVMGIQMMISYVILNFCMELYVNHFEIVFLLTMMPIYAIGYPLLVILSKRRPAVILEKHKLGAGNFMILLLMCFGVMIAGNIVGLIVNAVIGVLKGSPVVNPLDSMLGGNTLLMNIFVVGICAPVFEELMFRKLLVDRMVRFGEAAAVVVSGLMFGLFHGNFSQFFYAALLGFIFAYVYVKTGKIRYSIGFHMIINLSSALIMPVLQMVDYETITQLQNMLSTDPNLALQMIAQEQKVIFAVLIIMLYEFVVYGMAIAGIILLILKRKKFTLKKGQVVLPKGKRAAVVWGNIGMIAFTAGCLFEFVSTIFLQG